MALPKVTPGTYDYGAYAKPSQVKYNASGDLALAQGISKGVEGLVGLVKSKLQEKRDTDAKANEAQEEAVNALAVEQQKTKEDQNESKIKTLTGLADRAGSLLTAKQRREYKRELRAGDEDLTRKESRQALDKELRTINGEVDAFIALNKYDIDEDLLNRTDPASISPSSLPNFHLAKKLASGDYGTTTEDGRTYVTYNYMGTDGKEKEGRKLLTDLVENIDEYTEFSERFGFATSEDFNTIGQSIGERFNENEIKAFFTKEMGGVKYVDRTKLKKRMTEEDSYILSQIDKFAYAAVEQMDGVNDLEEYRSKAADYIIDNFITKTGADIVKPDALEWAKIDVKRQELALKKGEKFKEKIALAEEDVTILNENIKSLESTPFVMNLKSLGEEQVQNKAEIDSNLRRAMAEADFSMNKSYNQDTEEPDGYLLKHPMLDDFTITFSQLDDGSFANMLLTKLRTRVKGRESFLGTLNPPPPPPKD